MKEEAARWLSRAADDLSDAQFNLEGERLATAAFLGQQAAEKALKALLLQRQGRFPRIHDLAALAAEAKAPETLRTRCGLLSGAYVAARYPDIGEPVTGPEARDLVGIAGEVVAWVRTQLS